MSLSTIVRFQFGHAPAIDSVARNRYSIFVGMFLVLLTGIARNYDQMYFGTSLRWFFGPLLFSFFSGSFLFFILYKGFIRRHLENPEGISTTQQWVSFMSLFWMTAPVAWLYAIPVERFFNSYQAAQTNIALLAIVSLWRVLLMARIVSVLQGLPFIRAIGWVLVPACLEVLVISFIGPGFAQRIAAGMSGMRNAPEESLLIKTSAFAFTWAAVLLVLVLVILGLRRFQHCVKPFPERIKGRVTFVGLVAITALWVVAAIPAQREQQNFEKHAALIEQKKHREAVDFLIAQTQRGFPPSRRLEPNPYEYRVFEDLPGVMAVLKPTDPEWIRRSYFSHLDAYFSHIFLHGDTIRYNHIFQAVHRLPDGKAWLDRNRANIGKIKRRFNDKDRNVSEAEHAAAQEELKAVLDRLGINLEEIED